MEFAVIGLTHKEATVEQRNLVAFTQSKKIDAIQQLMDRGIEEVVILSTCNRSEIYIACEDAKQKSQEVARFILDFFSAEAIEHLFFIKEGAEAIRYLLRVAAGLDSLILGEDQILGQVKEAMEWSMELGSSKKYLNYLFREAITFAKRMKTLYRISENPLSLSSVAVKFLQRSFSELKDKHIFLIGTGEMGQLTMRYLQEAGMDHLYLCNRSGCLPESGLACRGELIPYDERYQAIQRMDIVISATSSPHLVLKAEHFPVLKKPILLLDMALPMDIDRKIADRPHVSLYDIDDLNEISSQSLAYRQQAADAMGEELEASVLQISEWVHQTQVDPIIESFHQICRESLADTMDLINRKVLLSGREMVYIEKLVDSALRRVLREPIKQLKRLDSEEEIHRYKEMIHKLFDL